MLPGKTYSIDDILQILRRRFWLVLLPVTLAGVATAWYQRTLKDVYTSHAVILIVPQRISEKIVESTVSSDALDRIQEVRRAVLSRSRLQSVVEQFDLYPEMRRTRSMDDVVDRLRADMFVEPEGNTAWVGYRGFEPVLVTKVAEHLGQLFINESAVDRQSQVQDTSQFLDAEASQALERLREAERRLAAWKQKHAGELPNQLGANLAVMQNTQAQLSDLRETMNADRARRLELEKQLADLEDPTRAAAALSVIQAQGRAGGAATTEQQLLGAQEQLAAYEQRGLRPGHPDLDAARRRVNDLQARLERETSLGRGADQAATAQATGTIRASRIEEVRSTIASIDKQLARSQDEERRLMAASADVQRRVDAMPTRETEETELTRDYDILQSAYRDLLQNKTRTQLSVNLEQRQAGEQFRLFEPARLPEGPDGPNRPLAIAIGLVVGLAIGAALIALIEFRDRSFKTDEDLADLLDLPVLAVVPVMKSDADVRRLFWRRIGVFTSLGSVVAGGLVFVVYALIRG